MTRAAVWILGSISGLLLAFGLLTLLTAGGGYGVSSSCASVEGAPPCTPAVDSITVSLPPHAPALAFTSTLLLLAVLIGLPAWIAAPILAERRGASGTTAILVVSIISTALLLVTIFSVVVLSPALTSPKTCLNGTGGDGVPQTCVTGSQAIWLAVLGIGSTPVLAAFIACLPAWTMALTRTVRGRRWGWFSAVLLLSPLALMLYGFLGSERRPAPAPAPAPAP
jgi:hypothetical protein